MSKSPGCEPEIIRAAAEMLVDAEHIAVLTGAGVSAESGLATFRDKETGFWAKYDPMELAHIDAFHRDPELVTRWYHERFTRAAACEPNDGHRALADIQRLQRERGAELSLITQNVDGLHQRAGSEGVIEIHGTILTWRSLDTGRHYQLDEIDFSTFPPRSETGALLRPNVIWFGEMLPEQALSDAQEAIERCDVFLSVGTSAVVWPAAGFASAARARGARAIEINPEATPLTDGVDLAVPAKSASALPAIAEQLRQIRAQ